MFLTTTESETEYINQNTGGHRKYCLKMMVDVPGKKNCRKVKRKNTPIIVIKAGSIKKVSRATNGSSFETDYYFSSYAE